MDTLSQQRVKLLDYPMAFPAKCAICGSGTKKVVDFGLDIEFYGVVYFCEECVGTIAAVSGYAKPVEREYPLAEVEREEYERVRNILDSVCRILNDYGVMETALREKTVVKDSVTDSTRISEATEIINESPGSERSFSFSTDTLFDGVDE